MYGMRLDLCCTREVKGSREPCDIGAKFDIPCPWEDLPHPIGGFTSPTARFSPTLTPDCNIPKGVHQSTSAQASSPITIFPGGTGWWSGGQGQRKLIRPRV